MKHIEANAVARGDYIFNSHASHAAYRWVRVIEAPRRQGDYIVIRTEAFDTWKHPREAVAVKEAA